MSRRELCRMLFETFDVLHQVECGVVVLPACASSPSVVHREVSLLLVVPWLLLVVRWMPPVVPVVLVVPQLLSVATRDIQILLQRKRKNYCMQAERICIVCP